MSRSARWTFTVNNPGDWIPVFDQAHMAYMVFQHEIGAAAATPHIQGYVRFKTRKALDTAKHFIADTAHMEVARGTEAQNHDYCTKADTRAPGTEPREAGTYDPTAGTQGKRSDLIAVADKLKAGATLQTIAMEHPSEIIKYSSGIERLSQLLLQPPLRRDLHVTVLWGPTGTGKSHRALNAFPEAYIVRMSGARSPWDQYNNQQVVIFEEFDPADCPPHQLNSWLDVWKLTLPCRYNNKHAFYTHVIILTNMDPTTWYAMFPQAQVQAVQRRLQEPMGHIYNVVDRETPVDFSWWTAAAAPAAAAPAPPPVPPRTPALPRSPPSVDPRPLQRAASQQLVFPDPLPDHFFMQDEAANPFGDGSQDYPIIL